MQLRPQSSDREMVTDGEAAASMRGLETIYLLRDRNWTSSINCLCVDVDLFNDIYVLVFGTGSVKFFNFPDTDTTAVCMVYQKMRFQ